MIKLGIVLALCTGFAAGAIAASSSDYPSKPVRLIVPLAPGGGVDALARGIAGGLSERFKHPIVVDNRAGAAGSIGAGLVQRSTADGYTLLFASASFLLYPLLHENSYDASKDFSPITQAVELPLVLVANASLPAKNITDLIALARSKPGSVTYGSSGNGGFPHLAGELLKAMTRTELVHVPYKGASLAIPDLLTGRIHMMFLGLNIASPHVKSGKLRIMGVSGKTRIRTAPDYPTLHEAGVPGFDASQAYGVFGPAGVPAAIRLLLQREIAQLLRTPDLVRLIERDGAEPVGSTPDAFGAYVREDTEKWRKVIQSAGIRLK